MKITLTFSMYDEDIATTMPTLVSAYDEYTEDAWGGVPDFHVEATDSLDKPGEARTCTIEIPDRFVRSLFETPEIPVTDWSKA